MTDIIEAEGGPLSGWVAGVNHGHHDAACALFRFGELVSFVEQERLSRKKEARGESPAPALRYCLDRAGLELRDLDAVALGSDHDRLARWYDLRGEERRRALHYDDDAYLFPTELFSGQLPARKMVVRHHLAHAASAFWPSGFEEAALLVIDAMGEDSSVLIARGDATGITPLRAMCVESSIGYFYEAASEYAGLGRNHAGKLMGLSAYGQPSMAMPLRIHDADLDWEGIARTELSGPDRMRARIASLRDHFSGSCFPYEPGDGDEVMAYANFAASVQSVVEDTILELAELARTETGCRNLAYAGGVALNCSANGVLSDSGLFDHLFVQPASTDAGVALGAGLVAAHQLYGANFSTSPMEHAYWGHASSESEIEIAFKNAGLHYERLDDAELVTRVGAVLHRGGAVAWHQGSAEVGPRALGARSILGDPRRRRSLLKINRIKQREVWRPLAPAVLADRFSDFFSGTPNPFMIVRAYVRADRARDIPAVVHVDGSARPQVVSGSSNPLYAKLLREFERLSGIPILINTSLNLRGEPLANTADDTISIFERTEVDAVAIGPFFHERSSSPV